MTNMKKKGENRTINIKSSLALAKMKNKLALFTLWDSKNWIIYFI